MDGNPGRKPERLPDRQGRPLRAALIVVAAVWVGLRVTSPALPLPAPVDRAVDSVHVYPSTESGRLAIHGWPDAVEEWGIPGIDDARAAFVRLDRSVDAANAALARSAADAAARVEVFEDGVVGLRLGGFLVAFPAPDADELTALADPDPGRPCETIARFARLLEIRLEEPADALQLEDSVQRRELLRLSRTLRDALDEAQADAATAVEAFRAETRDALRHASGPFLRRGRGPAIETLLAALLGALLRVSLRRRARGIDPVLPVVVAPVLALAAVFALRGTRFLPVHPLLGVTSAFVALAFAIGWLVPGWMRALARLDAPDPQPAPPAAPPAATEARPRTLAPPYAPPAPPAREERPPFFPRTRERR